MWPHTQAAIERLNAIASDSAEAARFLGTEQPDKDDPLGDLEQERGALVPLLQADRANHMIHDPYVVDRLGRIVQSTWRRLATSGGVKVPSFMGQPADVLPPNTVVCPELPPGPVIVFRYPIRTWADVQTLTLAEGPLGDRWRVWAVVDGARLGVVPQDAAIVGRTPLTIPAAFTVSPTGTYADMHVATAQASSRASRAVATCFFFSPVCRFADCYPIAFPHDT